MTLSPHIRTWLNWVLITSHPMRRYDENEQPTGIGSSALIDYRGRRFLLTAQHLVELDSRNWVLDLGYEPGKGTAYYRPTCFYYLFEYTRSTGDIREIDFCFSEVAKDLNTTYQHRTPLSAGEERPRHVFKTNLNSKPISEQIYAFPGEVKPEQHSPNLFATEMIVYPGLKYERTENEMHYFKLPEAHPGHDQFKGCSGAPIVDMNNEIVALVCSGSKDDDTIQAVSLSRYKSALDAYCTAQTDA